MYTCKDLNYRWLERMGWVHEKLQMHEWLGRDKAEVVSEVMSFIRTTGYE